MINLNLDPNKDFSISPSNSLPSQEWAFNPRNFHYITNLIGQPAPPPFVLNTQIKNYYNYRGVEYAKFYVGFNLRFYPDNSVIWVAASGVIPDASGEGYLLTSQNLNVVTTLNFQNVDLLTEGDYVVELEHFVKGETPSGQIVEIETIDYVLHLVRVGYQGIELTPLNLTYYHTLGEPLPAAQNLTITANDTFTITSPEHVTLSGGNLVLSNTVGGVKTYTGSSSQTVAVTLESTIIALGELLSPYVAYIDIINSSGATDNCRVRLYQYLSNQYFVYPTSLVFVAVKNYTEAPAQQVTLTGIGSFTVVTPSWLQVSPLSGNDSEVLNVIPIASGNLVEGIYTGNIVITTTSGVINVFVKHTVTAETDIGFYVGAVNFTRDRNGISNFYSDDENTVHLDLTTTSFDYNNQISKLTESNHKKGIFNNNTNFFLGNVVEKMMFTLNSLSKIDLDWFDELTEGYFTPVYKYYNPATTNLDLYFKNRETGLQVGATQSYYGIKFIKGRKPNRFIQQYGILDFKESPIRVTKNSVALLNLYRSVGFNKIQILINNVVDNTYYPDGGNHELFAMRVDFSDTVPGDVIDAKVFNSPNNDLKYYTQRYIVFPEGKHSYHIGWENEHDVLEVYEFTGDYLFSTKYDEVIAKTFSKFLEETQKYEGDKEIKFIANTGWILKSNQERIDSLLDSKRAWLIYKEDKAPLSLVPRTSKIVNDDSEEQTIQYQVEFTLNPTHELENNTF